jgi:predicted  nucleic acid-binding Zn-ribbon protein
MRRRSGRLREPPPKPSPYAGRTTCLRCDRAFESWDRRQNRLCPNCRDYLREEPSDEPASIDRPALRAARRSADDADGG